MFSFVQTGIKMSLVGCSSMSSVSLTSSSPLAALSELEDTDTMAVAPAGIPPFDDLS